MRICSRGRGALLLLTLLAARPAAAGETADADEAIAKDHFLIGLKYYDGKRYEAAVKEFLSSYQLSRRPALLFNIAKAYEKLNEAGRATLYFKRYLREAPVAEERIEIEASLYRLSLRVHLLSVRSQIAAVEVRIDDEPLGPAPLLEWPLTAGIHQVEVRRDGFTPALLELDLRGGIGSELVLNPRRDRVPPAGAPVLLDPTPAGPPVPPQVKLTQPPAPLLPSTSARSSEPVSDLSTARPPAPRASTPATMAPLFAPNANGPAPTSPPPAAAVRRGTPGWVVAVAVLAAAAAIGVGVGLGVFYGGTDYPARTRDNCRSPGCVLIDGI